MKTLGIARYEIVSAFVAHLHILHSIIVFGVVDANGRLTISPVPFSTNWVFRSVLCVWKEPMP